MDELDLSIPLSIAAFAVAYGGSYLVTPLTARLALRLGLVDVPEEQGRKRHRVATPYLGGLAIIVGLLLGVPFLLFFTPADLSAVPVVTYGAVIGIGLALATIGLVDDARSLPRTLRLATQVGAAVGVWALGFRVESLPWEWANLAITLIWMVGITNAFNLLDNMDGLSAGLAGVSAVTLSTLGIISGLPILPFVAAALAGGCFGFLSHNRHPAKVFMGDSGSLFIGYLLALLALKLRFDNLVEVTFLVPVVVLGVPIFDTTLVVFSRMRHRRAIFLGGRDHVSHRLVQIGLPVKAAVALMYWSAICLGWLGIVISRSNVQVGWMLLGFVVALSLFFGAVLWRVPVYEEQAEKLPLQTSEDLDALEVHQEASVHPLR
jgi:UDP-GlcNAc:undecaprenyl-phosphate GlcNAc-1-phosphate transferase